jgi:alpha-L-rhamnosidase
VSSFYYITELRIVARYAQILGKSADHARYSKLAANAAVAFNAAFYDAENKTYAEPGRSCQEYLSPQTRIALANALGVIPAVDKSAVIQTLVDDVAAHGWHLDVGIVGVKYLLQGLSDGGRTDVALMIAQARSPPSYIYMVEQGATTLWETWTGSRYQPTASWNQPKTKKSPKGMFKKVGELTCGVAA